jgi:hypothetical protein
VSLFAEKAKVDPGTHVTLTGRVFSSDPSCQDDEFVRIQRRLHGTTTFIDFQTTNTASDGTFSAEFDVNKSADYQAVAPGHDQCLSAQSEPVTVGVKVTVEFGLEDRTPKQGDIVNGACAVRPNHKGTKVTLQRKKGGRFVKVAAYELDKQSNCAFEIEASWSGKRVFRMTWVSQDDDHETGRSTSIRVTTH